MNESGPRFVGIDLHEAYLMIGAVDAAKQIVLPFPTKICRACAVRAHCTTSARKGEC